MRDAGSKKTSLGDFNSLLCNSTLKASLRSSSEPQVPAREGLKELLSPNLQISPSGSSATIAKKEPEFSRWEHCLDLLVEEFLLRKAELLRLNKARRDQVEVYLRIHSKSNVTLDQAVQGRVGSPEQEALQLFAYQAAVFQLLQILLVKRWADKGLMPAASLRPSGHTLNWLITGFLKKCSKQGPIGRHDWSFVKQNLFSWYSPAKETWERLRLRLEAVNLAKESSDFPARLLRSLGARNRLSLLGFNPTLIDSNALWQLLLEQKAVDERLESAAELDFTSGNRGPILISGLRNGESLNSLRSLSRSQELQGIWAYTDSDFERFLSEMFLLWDCDAEIPRINLLSREALKELSRSHRGATLFHNSVKVPHQAQLAACFQDSEGKELIDARVLLEPLRENGLLLIASDQFWPTDNSDLCEKLREQVLKHASVRLIVDLRQLTGTAGETLPKGIAILEKCESRELRDSNRPALIRARGHLQSHQVQIFWSSVLEQLRISTNPGEVTVKSLNSVGEGVRLEIMSAAACQQQLRSAPWTTLSDPRFYEASSKLRRSLHKAHTFGSVLRWKAGVEMPSRRGILLRENENHLHASLPASEGAKDDSSSGQQYIFLPDKFVAESPQFFLSQIYSAPVQFWYRLETESAPTLTPKALERQSEQRLKLMPLVRLFEPGTLLAAQNPKSVPAFVALDEVKNELNRIFRQPSRGMAENSRIHEIVLNLESSISQNIGVCSEFTRHLFPDLQIHRWNLPHSLPEVAPRQALEIFQHLDSTPLSSHPAIHQARMRTAQDFKITNLEYSELPMGGMAELKLFQGVEPAMKLSGPTILLKAACDSLQNRLGRPWRESSEKLRYPTDIALVQTQLREVVRSAEKQLSACREHVAILDQIFCCLLGLSPSYVDETARVALRHHLSPDDSRVKLPLAQARIAGMMSDQNFFKQAGSEFPKGILQ